MTARIDKTITRLQQRCVKNEDDPDPDPDPYPYPDAVPPIADHFPGCRIQEGQYYEAHQQLRVVAARYVKQQNWSAAVDILYSGAQALLKKSQYGSGADLCRLLVSVYQQAEQKPDSGSKGGSVWRYGTVPVGGVLQTKARKVVAGKHTGADNCWWSF